MKQFWQDLHPIFQAYRKQQIWLLLSILLAFVTLIAGIGLLALSGWFITASAIAGLSYATAHSFNFFTPGAGVRGFSITRTAGRYLERLVSHEATFRVLTGLRVWFFSALQPRSSAVLQRFRKGELLNRLVADIDALDHLYLRLFSPVVAALLVLGAVLALLAWLAPAAAWVVAVIVLVTMLALPALFYRLGAEAGAHISTQQGRLRTVLLDYLGGLRELEVYGAEAYQRQRVLTEEQTLVAAQKHMANLSGLAMALMSAGSGLAMVVILLLGAPQVVAGELPGPVLVLAVFLALALLETLAPLPSAFQFLGQSKRSARRLAEVTSLPEVTFPADDSALGVSKSGLSFNSVSFAYEGRAATLNEISLSIKAGEHVALLGPTGCGKSTLIQLLCRELECGEGEIVIGDTPLCDFSERRLRQQLAVLPQRVHLFNGTLADNIRLSNAKASDEQLLEVLDAVGLGHLAPADQLLSLWVGQGGVALSGGEVRRVGIARVLLSEAPVILLDEPTEGLDALTEDKIMSLLWQFCQDKTLLFITHRLVGLKQMDRICLLDQGQIIEQGSHAELLAQDGHYARTIAARIGEAV